MLKFFSFLTLLFVAATGLRAQTIDTWVTSQGAMFEASVKQVIPGQVTFVLKDGREQPLPLVDLSDRSRTKLIEFLGLGGTPVPVAATLTAPLNPVAPAASQALAAQATATSNPVVMPNPTATVPAEGSAIDVTDAAQISARIGQEATLIGTVKEVITLGGAGHKLVKFDGSDFNLFISKQALDKSADWILDDLPGKRLQVRGKVETYRDLPQIRGNEPSQISRVQ